MNGQCDTCGAPAIEECDATDCLHEMCEQHTTRKPVPALDVNNLPSKMALTFCREHAALAQQ